MHIVFNLHSLDISYKIIQYCKLLSLTTENVAVNASKLS